MDISRCADIKKKHYGGIQDVRSVSKPACDSDRLMLKAKDKQVKVEVIGDKHKKLPDPKVAVTAKM